jgi:murein L,D-transpeptidase YafK
MKQHIVILLISAMIFSSQSKDPSTFKDKQQRYPRVRTAMLEKDSLLRKLFAGQGLVYPPHNLFIRVFKQEKVLEVWTFSASDSKFKKVRDYPICRTSGSLGPKRREGDLQIPEGFYHIDRFNPKSSFYLSLGINYPNRSDQILGKKGDLGGDIFLHGGCVTVGCIPITDDYIKEVYWLAVQAKAEGQSKIPVHIFPTKLDNHTMAQFKKTSAENETLIKFWENLQIGYEWFEKHRNLPKISVNSDGIYQFSTSSSP